MMDKFQSLSQKALNWNTSVAELLEDIAEFQSLSQKALNWNYSTRVKTYLEYRFQSLSQKALNWNFFLAIGEGWALCFRAYPRKH